MTEKCGCRFNCLRHDSMVQQTGGMDEPMEKPGLCTKDGDFAFFRFLCPKCEYMQIYYVCEGCYQRMVRWLRNGVLCRCEKCRRRVPVKESWSLYKDVSESV